jgi:hypothetical protein
MPSTFGTCLPLSLFLPDSQYEIRRGLTLYFCERSPGRDDLWASPGGWSSVMLQSMVCRCIKRRNDCRKNVDLYIPTVTGRMEVDMPAKKMEEKLSLTAFLGNLNQEASATSSTTTATSASGVLPESRPANEPFDSSVSASPDASSSRTGSASEFDSGRL